MRVEYVYGLVGKRQGLRWCYVQWDDVFEATCSKGAKEQGRKEETQKEMRTMLVSRSL